MKYVKTKDKIIITDLTNFNAQHIMECGQVFRYKKINNDYIIYSTDKFAVIKHNFNKNNIEILTKDVDYFENYFDLKQNYSFIKQSILNNCKTDNNKNVMLKALEFGSGMRILKQDSFEMVISFVISQNNNIKRIQSSVEKMCQKFGTNMGEYHAFPTPNQLANATEADFKEFGLGYRSKYMIEVVKAFQNFDYDNFKNKSLKTQIDFLTKIKGIGPKVADCILLFGFYQMQVFPVDTWIEKVYNQHFNYDDKILNRVHIRQKLVEIFNEYSGYAQQYLFYYQRSFLKK